jgi:hypothetical protein
MREKARETLESLLYYPAVFIVKTNMKIGMLSADLDRKKQKRRCDKCHNRNCIKRV